VLPTMNEPVIRWFSPSQMKQIIVEASEPYKTMFWVDAECGIRGGELCALQVEDLDLKEHNIAIKRSVWKEKLQTTKTKKGIRKFSISPELSERLKGYLSNQWRDNPEGLLFATREGTPYDNRDIVDQVLHPILERLEIPRAGLHAFRHGNETLMDHLGIPMGVRRDRLGHEKNETTMGYTHVMSNDDRLTASKIGRILCPNLPNSQPVEAVNN
jgi:integrase